MSALAKNSFNVPLFSILTRAIMDSVDFHTRTFETFGKEISREQTDDVLPVFFSRDELD
jgi:hypothetical protein